MSFEPSKTNAFYYLITKANTKIGPFIFKKNALMLTRYIKSACIVRVTPKVKYTFGELPTNYEIGAVDAAH